MTDRATPPDCEGCEISMHPIFPDQVAAGQLESAWGCFKCLKGNIVTIKPLEFVTCVVEVPS